MNRRKIVSAVVPLVVVAVLLKLATLKGGDGESSIEASGTVEATEAQLGFQLPGRIASVLVREGDRVRAGDTLALLERAELEARRQQAVAQLAAARALLDELLSGSRAEERAQAREQLRAAADQFNDAQRELQRVRRLFDAGALSQEVLDRATLAFELASSRRDQAEQQLRLVETGPRPERIAAQRALVAQAEAAVRQAEAALAYAVIIAPFEGVITVRDREPGETVAAGAPVLTVMNLGDRWVRIYVPEDRIGAVSLGQPADIRSDTYPGISYPGEVSFIASHAEFTPRNVQTREERVKLVYAVKVRVVRDERNHLKPGVPADVRLHLR